MTPGTGVPDTARVADYTRSYSNPEYLATADPLTMLRLNEALRTALRAYDEECVAAARRAGATWEQIGQAVAIPRQNAQRKWSHVAP
jgi:hypothetical protein